MIYAAGILFIVGMILLLFTLNAIKRSKQSIDWPTTQGEIIISEMDTGTGMSTGLKLYDPRVTYKYKVGEKEYISSRIYFGVQIGASYSENKIRSLVDKYKVEQRIQVSYDPGRPDLSVIEPGYHKDLNFGVFSGIILITISLLLVLLS